MTSILVIGGSRFIGKTLLQKIKDKGHKITVINRGNVPKEKYLPKGAVHFAIDRNDEEKMVKVLKDKSFDIVYDTCCITEKHAVTVVKALLGKVKRHVHVSSGSVYDMEPGAVLTLPIEEDHPFPEIKEDMHPYIRDKTQAEKVLLLAQRDSNFPVTIIRPTYVYGPDNYVYREAYFFDRISRDRPILIPEKGYGFFDLVHVDDLAEMMILLGEGPAEKVVGEAFNGSSAYFVSGNMLTHLIAKILQKEAKIVYYPLKIAEEFEIPPQFTLFPYVPEDGFTMSTLKIERELDFGSKFMYETGMKDAFKWWSKQKNPEPNFEIEDELISYLEVKDNEERTDEEMNKIHSELQTMFDKMKEKIK
ncbi:MAG: NAD-dependent epimerase/dehydratase family protein [Candidatus Kariarchaeaceae archaeon]|jgi:nucleoside-diphosphate-sugar epimerase